MQKKLNKSTVLLNQAPLIGLVIVVAVFAALTGGKSISSMNIKIMFNSLILTAIASTGAIFTFSCGAMDMSVGGSVCIAAIVAAIAGQKTESAGVIIAVVLGVSLLIGLFKGLAAAYLSLPIFIVTFILGTLLSSFGLVLLGNQTTLYLKNYITLKDSTAVCIAILVIFYLFCLFLFRYTRLGRELKLLGGNMLAAGQMGINAKKAMIAAFLMNGLGAGLAGVVSILRTKTVSSATGGSVASDLMIAIVLGGMPISGGPKSRIGAALIGSVTITVLNNGLSLCNVSNEDIQIVRGVVFLIVVFITSMTYRTKLLPR